MSTNPQAFGRFLREQASKHRAGLSIADLTAAGLTIIDEIQAVEPDLREATPLRNRLDTIEVISDAEMDDIVERERFRRASGECVCPVCKRPYWQHQAVSTVGRTMGDMGLLLRRLCRGCPPGYPEYVKL